jgi:hypothetical protein
MTTCVLTETGEPNTHVRASKGLISAPVLMTKDVELLTGIM